MLTSVVWYTGTIVTRVLSLPRRRKGMVCNGQTLFSIFLWEQESHWISKVAYNYDERGMKALIFNSGWTPLRAGVCCLP